MNDEDVPQLRLNAQYRRMLDRDNGATKEVRDYVRERYTSAIQLMKNIEQRKQTILKVCQAIVRRQTEFLSQGLDFLKPMMIKEVAEEVGVHPSTVSRAVASKYVHTPQGVFELRYFFSEAVQGPSGGGTPLLLLKRKVKKMIEDEDRVFFFQAEDGIRDFKVTGVQTCALPIYAGPEVIETMVMVARDLAAKARPYTELDARFAGQVVVRRRGAGTV